MIEELLPYYDRELTFLKGMGGEFAKAHPKIAGRLRLDPDSVEDPHVARLIESVAFVNARVRKKLDDDFPELSEAILSVLSPHHLAPIPSMAIVQFECDLAGTSQSIVPAGTQIETEAGYGTSCYFRTVYPVTAWPVRVAKAELVGAPFQAPRVPGAAAAASVLRLRIEPGEGQCPIGELGIASLRFFLRGQSNRVQDLYEMLMDDVICVAVGSGPDDRSPLVLDASCMRAVGFERDEGLLPYARGTDPGQRVLTEFFLFAPKFHFVELRGLDGGDASTLNERMEIFIFMRRINRELEQTLDEESLGLGCTPVVNLFDRRAEPIEVDGTQSTYHVVPDARDPAGNEVYSVNSVVALSREGERREYLPFYGIRHDPVEEDGAYWFADRREGQGSPGGKGAGTEVYLATVDLEKKPQVAESCVLETKVTCLNRSLPSKLPFGGGEPRLVFSEGGAGIAAVRCLTPFTETIRPKRGHGALWRVVSQLSLNHLSISGGDWGAEALREILRVNDLFDTAVTRSIIASVQSVESRPSMVRTRERGQLTFCRGTEIRVQLDEERLGTSGAFQFAVVLDRFLSSYCSINSFVQLVTNSSKLEEGEKRWTPRTGTRPLV